MVKMKYYILINPSSIITYPAHLPRACPGRHRARITLARILSHYRALAHIHTVGNLDTPITLTIWFSIVWEEILREDLSSTQ